LMEHLPRTMRVGDILSGARREENVGDEIEPCGTPSVIYGKLGRSGVGPFEESLFVSFDTAARLAKGRYGNGVCIPNYDSHRISAVLVRLGFGATPEQARFAIGRLPGVKVVAGSTIVTSTRQTMTALIAGIACFTVLMLIGSLLMVSLLFSAIIAERRREVGLMRAIGSRRNQVARMLLTEAAFVTSLGGFCGVLFGGGLLLLFQRSLVYYLESLQIQFVWPSPAAIATFAATCAGLASLVGLIGAFVPAWRTSREEPFVLIQSEGG
jgi:putative ABC transport system permease protein